MDSEAIYERLRSSFQTDRDGLEGHLVAALPMKQVAELMRIRFRAGRAA
ncbi:hypothetical protein [Methylorubrum populi]|nr:hypothetical protein [Methylorubrum populi]